MTNSIKVNDNIIIRSAKHDKPILVDVRHQSSNSPQPVVVFAHGFKGFKDWGHWNMIANQIVSAGYIVVKFNFSHNGTTPEKPIDFADLEAFSENTITKEVNDLGAVIDHIYSEKIPLPKADLSKLTLIGHSRGGGTVLIKASEDQRVSSVVTWAAIADFEDRWPKDVLQEWKDKGVFYVYNGRTEQNMPMKYEMVEDYYQNKDRLSIPKAVKNLNIPLLVVHGTEDPTVDVKDAKKLHELASESELHIIEGADHVFNGKHPFDGKELPFKSQELVDKTLSFLDQNRKA